MAPPGSASRALLRKLLLASSCFMLGLAALFWLRVIPTAGATRPVLAGALFVAGLIDGFLGLRPLGES